MNFWNQIKLVFGISPFVVIEIWLLRPSKGILVECTLSIRTTVCRKTFTVGCAQDTGILPYFLFWLRPRYELPVCFTTTESGSHTFMGLPPTAWRSVVYN